MKRHPILIPASLLALALAACGPAPDLEEGPAAPVAPAAGSPAEAVPVAGQEEGVTVRDPWLRQPPPSAGVSAGYLLIENPGAYADRLLAVECNEVQYLIGQAVVQLIEKFRCQIGHLAANRVGSGVVGIQRGLQIR